LAEAIADTSRSGEDHTSNGVVGQVSREWLLHALYEAAELEHNLMCTYLYAAFSLRSGVLEGLSATQAEAVARWRRTILDVAIDEMGHLVAVWNITAALGGTPHFGRPNFPLDPGVLPAGVIVRLAPFNVAVLQHFVHLERPEGSQEPDGDGFAPDFAFSRAARRPRITPMGVDYETVGAFYSALSANLRAFVARVGEAAAFCGDPALQLSPAELTLLGAQPVICSKSALAGFAAIVLQGEGAPADAAGSHFQKFTAIRGELAALKVADPAFTPAFPAATNPVLRTPMRSGRVWIEDEDAAAAADVANACYALMLRLIAYAYMVPRPHPQKALAVDLALGLMRAMTPLAERVARLPAGPSNPHCNAGVSFTALRDAAPLPTGPGAGRFFRERLDEVNAACAALDDKGDVRVATARRQLIGLVRRAVQGFAPLSAPLLVASAPAAGGAPTPASMPVAAPGPAASPSPVPALTDSLRARAQARAAAADPIATAAADPAATVVNGVEIVQGRELTLHFEAKRCIHARFCVTGAPQVFLANVKGPWIKPDAMPVDALVEIAHACPSGAIRYVRKDGHRDEFAPPVNLVNVREAGPYAVRACIVLNGEPAGFRVTLCRCGASKNKPFCDGSHHDIGFAATGEPVTIEAQTLAARDGVLAIEPQTDGPLQVRGNLEIQSGTGRMVTRVTSTKLCRCGRSENKPFCDGTHVRIGFIAD
jgi:CDGSH-type Zn-finger protein/uncharacterized Fe-S cluster protein YjdI